MSAWLDFAEGPLFRFAFVVMAFGLARLVLLAVRNLLRMKERTPDKSTDILGQIRAAGKWLSPFRWFAERRGYYTAASIIFHMGLLLVPIFFLPHVTLWRQGFAASGLGFAFPAIPSVVADALTLLTVGTGLLLVVMRFADKGSRAISGPQDWLLTPLCVAIFVTGYLAAHPTSNPFGYEGTRLVHVLAGDLVLLLMPFTKLAHVVLLPFTQAITDLSWKLVPGVGEKVRSALGHQDRPI